MSTNPRGRAWVEIRADALRRNYTDIRDQVGGDVRILPMVKAEGYGLGAAEVIRAVEPLEPWGYGVATVDEGRALRASGVQRPVVIMSPIPPDQVEEAVRARLQVSVSDLAILERLRAAASAEGAPAEVHVDVDTGMGRSGFDVTTAGSWLREVADRCEAPVRWTGIFTHLHSADESAESVREQWARFMPVVERARGLVPQVLVHVLNSAGVFRSLERRGTIVRPGIYLYGGALGADQPAPRPVVSIKARVVHVRDVAPGTTVGYGSTYAADRPGRWATLSIGYGDGLPRALGNRGHALVGGQRVPIIGRISMDVTVVDITGVSSVEPGDVATLLGSDGAQAITVDEVAAQAGTISYEVLTGLTRRLPRVWLESAAA